MRSRTVRSLVLSGLLVSMLSMPATAAIDRDSGGSRDMPILQRIVHVLKHFFTATVSDTLSVPKP